MFDGLLALRISAMSKEHLMNKYLTLGSVRLALGQVIAHPGALAPGVLTVWSTPDE